MVLYSTVLKLPTKNKSHSGDRGLEIPGKSDIMNYCEDIFISASAAHGGFDRLTGGTAYTVRYAMKQGVPVFNTSSRDVRQLALKRE